MNIYLRVKPYQIFTSKSIRTNWNLQFQYYETELNALEVVCKYTFAAFLKKIDELSGLFEDLSMISEYLQKYRQEVTEELQV